MKLRSTKLQSAKLRLALGTLLALAAGQALACYTVYGPDDRVLYQSVEPPVDMRRPLHETVPVAFPGGHLVFVLGQACAAQPLVARAEPARGGASPLLTDRQTAAAMGLPHTVLANGVAVVPQPPAGMRPGVVVAESGLPDAAAPDTSAMGAGPARTPLRSRTVITEMYNPPITAVQPAR